MQKRFVHSQVIDGPHSGRQGQIRHLFRNFAFLYSRMMLDNGGIFVCKCRHLELAGGGKAGGRAGGAGAGAAGAGSMPGFMSPRLSSPMHPSQGGGGGAGGGGRGRGGPGNEKKTSFLFEA